MAKPLIDKRLQSDPDEDETQASSTSPWEAIAILDGRQTQLRRPLTLTRRYMPGDLLWCREQWSVRLDHSVSYIAEREEGRKYGSARTMPRAYSRITLQVISVVAQHGNAATYDDATAEGYALPDVAYAIPWLRAMWGAIDVPLDQEWGLIKMVRVE